MTKTNQSKKTKKQKNIYIYIVHVHNKIITSDIALVVDAEAFLDDFLDLTSDWNSVILWVSNDC